MKKIISKVQRGFMPLAILLLAGAFIAAGILTFAPQGYTFADSTSDCGNGNMQAPDEVCDDGNTDDGDYCSADCLTVTGSCGDSITQTNEECDDGNSDNTDDCLDTCVNATCGDTYTWDGVEECDEGGETATCNANCTIASCGDGIANATAGEVCDDGENNGEYGYCLADCSGIGPHCGDEITNGPEECDDGDETADCNANCTFPVCGDGIANATAGEVCDDGYADACGTCNADCTDVGTGPGECGDGDHCPEFEQCDDGNLLNGDGCSYLCNINPDPANIVANTLNGYDVTPTYHSFFDPRNVYWAVHNSFVDGTVLLKEGIFNFGTSSVFITNSVTIAGEGVDKTKIIKTGYGGPDYVWNHGVFAVNSETVDVTIRDIHFTDYYGAAINAYNFNSLNILNNKLTLDTAKGRGWFSGGDRRVMTIFIRRSPEGSSLTIKGNYIDTEEDSGSMAHTGYWHDANGNPLDPDDPATRPDIINDYYATLGIVTRDTKGSVLIDDNHVKNVTAKGIMVLDSFPTCKAKVINNIVESNVYGSYYGSWKGKSAIGISSESGWANFSDGGAITIKDNWIYFNEGLNQIGIWALGMEGFKPEAGGVFIEDNHIESKNGYVGILLSEVDQANVKNNTIVGSAYFGVRVRTDYVGSYENEIKNNMDDLTINPPDSYTDAHIGDGWFPNKLRGYDGESGTANIWLDRKTRKNEVEIKPGETVIDEGSANEIMYY
jgi:cysteine-rich repeat protein